MTEEVVLVDDRGDDIGRCEKLEAHRRDLRHRAFSVFLFDRVGKLLLQKRALSKYHSAGLWTNTCCGHPRPGEAIAAAARRRLHEEMGLDCELHEMFQFSYRAVLENDLTENEVDHVFIGINEQVPRPNQSEVADWKFADCNHLAADLRLNPQCYTVWLRLCFERVCQLTCRANSA